MAGWMTRMRSGAAMTNDIPATTTAMMIMRKVEVEATARLTNDSMMG